MYSQRDEEKYILAHFRNKDKGAILEIGAYDGKSFSNTLALIEKGWVATLVEPSPTVFPILKEFHKGNKKIDCHNVAIGTENKKMKFWDSNGDAVSSLYEEEARPWEAHGVKFTEVEVDVITYHELNKRSLWKSFDFINIDVEGDRLGLEILQQIPMEGVQMVCIEAVGELRNETRRYLNGHGMEKLHETAENLIMVKK